jgi:hypothetical protein
MVQQSMDQQGRAAGTPEIQQSRFGTRVVGGT